MNSVRPAPPVCEFYSQNSVFFLIDGFPKGAVVCTFANINDENFVAENDMEECFCVLDVLRVLGKGQSHNNGIFLQNLTQPLMRPQLGYVKK